MCGAALFPSGTRLFINSCKCVMCLVVISCLRLQTRLSVRFALMRVIQPDFTVGKDFKGPAV